MFFIAVAMPAPRRFRPGDRQPSRDENIRTMTMTRRTALFIAAGAAGGLFSGCGDQAVATQASAGTGASPTAGTGADASPDATGPVSVRPVTFTSVARGREVNMVVVAPSGSDPGRPLPVCLVLHGRGDDARSAVTMLGLDTQLTAALAAGVAPFALVTVDGGEAYWHRRVSGDDPESMILDEVLPHLAAIGLRTTRIAAAGWSMGGYGALLLARRHPDLIVAAAASSPALWRSSGASAAGAFDSKSDFTEHAILGTAPAPGVSYRIDCGESDPFYAVSRQAAADLNAAERDFGPGGHNPAYWRSAVPGQLRFAGAALLRAS